MDQIEDYQRIDNAMLKHLRVAKRETESRVDLFDRQPALNDEVVMNTPRLAR